jgi:hypothetical protein
MVKIIDILIASPDFVDCEMSRFIVSKLVGPMQVGSLFPHLFYSVDAFLVIVAGPDEGREHDGSSCFALPLRQYYLSRLFELFDHFFMQLHMFCDILYAQVLLPDGCQRHQSCSFKLLVVGVAFIGS